MSYELLEKHIVEWAKTQPAIRALISVGSRARGEVDQWSDLDLVIFTTDRERYAKDDDWLRGFGTVWLTYLENAGAGDPEWFAFYEGGLKLDALLFSIQDAALDTAALLASFPYRSVIARGVDVLYDREGTPRRIPAQPFTAPAPLTQPAFDHLINGFLLDAVNTAKFVARNDLWRAQRSLAQQLRSALLTLIAWHAYGRDTWYAGRFIDKWADQRVLASLPSLFPQYDQKSMKRTILAILDLFRWLGEETTTRVGIEFPTAYEHIAALIQSILANVASIGDQ
ncbi:MAG: aminoglycoside 6-adenylyltransferase [Anaerolineae bacterium]